MVFFMLMVFLMGVLYGNAVLRAGRKSDRGDTPYSTEIAHSVSRLESRIAVLERLQTDADVALNRKFSDL